MQLSNSKTIAKNTIYLYIRMALSMVVSLYTVRAVVNILGIEDYGLYNAIGGVVTSLSFLTAVLANASQRFFAIEIGKGNLGDVNKYFCAIFQAYLVLTSVIFLLVESIGLYLLNNTMTIPGERLMASNIVFQISFCTFLISLLGAPFSAIVIAYEKMNIYAFASIFESFAKLGIVYCLYNSPIDRLVFYASLLLMVTISINIIYLYNARKIANLKINLKVKKNILKELFSYSGWTLFGTMSGVAGSQGVNILLNIFSGPIANTAFAISNQVSSTIQMFASSFFTAVRPPLTKSYSASNFEYMYSLFNFSNKAIFALTFTLTFPLLAKTEFVLHLWLGKVSLYMVEFVRLMLIYALLISLSNPITTLVQAAGKVKMYHTIVDGFALFILPLYYAFFKLGFDVKYSLCITVVVFAIAHLLRLYVLQTVVDFSIKNYMYRFLIPSMFVCLLSYVIHKTVSFYLNGIVCSNVIEIFVCSISVLILSFFFLLNKAEKSAIYTMIKKIAK